MRYGWPSFYWKVLRLRGMEAATREAWFSRELGFAEKDPIPLRRKKKGYFISLIFH